MQEAVDDPSKLIIKRKDVYSREKFIQNEHLRKKFNILTPCPRIAKMNISPVSRHPILTYNSEYGFRQNTPYQFPGAIKYSEAPHNPFKH